jgi:hypothetical protein
MAAEGQRRGARAVARQSVYRVVVTERDGPRAQALTLKTFDSGESQAEGSEGREGGRGDRRTKEAKFAVT